MPPGGWVVGGFLCDTVLDRSRPAYDIVQSSGVVESDRVSVLALKERAGLPVDEIPPPNRWRVIQHVPVEQQIIPGMLAQVAKVGRGAMGRENAVIEQHVLLHLDMARDARAVVAIDLDAIPEAIEDHVAGDDQIGTVRALQIHSMA